MKKLDTRMTMVMATAMPRNWAIVVGGVEGAYLIAELGGPPVCVRLSLALWAAARVC